jgi:hypothetical protein
LKKIVEVQASYKAEPVNAIIRDDYIISGLAGYKVDIEKSYSKMKVWENLMLIFLYL